MTSHFYVNAKSRRTSSQYTPEQPERPNQIEAGLRSLRGLYLCGNSIDRMAVGDGVRRSREWADRIHSQLPDAGKN
ncbi:MAG: hypothetical protein ACP5D7_17155 [Limnospira sp.]